MNFFDLHCDTAFELLEQNTTLTNTDLAVNFQGDKHFENWFQTFAIWINDNTEKPFELYQKLLIKKALMVGHLKMQRLIQIIY